MGHKMAWQLAIGALRAQLQVVEEIVALEEQKNGLFDSMFIMVLGLPSLANSQPTLFPSTSICTPPKSTFLPVLAFCTRAGSHGSGFLL